MKNTEQAFEETLDELIDANEMKDKLQNRFTVKTYEMDQARQGKRAAKTFLKAYHYNFDEKVDNKDELYHEIVLGLDRMAFDGLNVQLRKGSKAPEKLPLL